MDSDVKLAFYWLTHLRFWGVTHPLCCLTSEDPRITSDGRRHLNRSPRAVVESETSLTGPLPTNLGWSRGSDSVFPESLLYVYYTFSSSFSVLFISHLFLSLTQFSFLFVKFLDTLHMYGSKVLFRQRFLTFYMSELLVLTLRVGRFIKCKGCRHMIK